MQLTVYCASEPFAINVHTGIGASIQAHPIKTLGEAGIRFSIGDDDLATSRIRFSQELTTPETVLGFAPEQILRIQLTGIAASFVRQPEGLP